VCGGERRAPTVEETGCNPTSAGSAWPGRSGGGFSRPRESASKRRKEISVTKRRGAAAGVLKLGVPNLLNLKCQGGGGGFTNK
jgi:hypothetical protein